MTLYKVLYEEGARQDIINIVDYITATYHDPVNASRIAIRIFRKCEALANFPKSSAAHRIGGLHTEYRFAHIKNYTIIYYVREDYSEVIIRAIVNSRRDIESILSDY